MKKAFNVSKLDPSKLNKDLYMYATTFALDMDTLECKSMHKYSRNMMRAAWTAIELKRVEGGA